MRQLIVSIDTTAILDVRNAKSPLKTDRAVLGRRQIENANDVKNRSLSG